MSNTKATTEIARPRRRDDLIERELPDELILYDVDKDQMFLLNHTSAAIWDLCDGRRSADEIADEIAGHFAASLDVVREDVRRIFANYQEWGLLT